MKKEMKAKLEKKVDNEEHVRQRESGEGGKRIEGRGWS